MNLLVQQKTLYLMLFGMQTNIQENLQKVKSTVRYLIEQNIDVNLNSLNSVTDYFIKNKNTSVNNALVLTAILAISDAKQGQPTSSNEGYQFLYNVAKEILEEMANQEVK